MKKLNIENATIISPWTVRESETALNERWATVQKDTCILPDGKIVDDYFYWVGGDFAQVFALTENQEVVLVRQYKHGVKEIVLELPAGGVEATEKDPLIAAKRELLEETGFESTEWVSLGQLNVSSAKSTTHAFPFLALNARQTAQQHVDENEVIEVLLCTVEELLDLISNGEIRDSNSIAASLLALNYLKKTSR